MDNLLTEIEPTAAFFDGFSARPAPVRVLLYQLRVHLHDPYDDRFIQSFPLSAASYNCIGDSHFLYLDAQGLQYLKFDAQHPLLPALKMALASANQSWAERLMRQKLVLLVPLVAVLGLGLYFLLLGLVPFLGMRMIGRDAEITLGNRLYKVMLSEVDLLSGKLDTAGTAQLQAFAARLKLSDQYPIRLTLVQSPVVNAFALPGGQVVVYTGILEKIETPEGLAALLAHESSHVNQRHSLRALLRSSANALLVSILFGDVTGASGVLAGNIENFSGLRYSRSLESEADELGMDLLRANKIAPQGMIQLMRTLEMQGDLPDALLFLSSHPLTRDRIKAAKAYCNRYQQSFSTDKSLAALFANLKKAANQKSR